MAVVGAGPGGGAAAFHLARRGAKVILLEKAALPRYKTCGGGLLGRAFRHLPFAIDHVVERSCFRAELNWPWPPLHFETERPTPIVAMTMRSTFDAFMASQAEQCGAHLESNCPVTALKRSDSGVELQTIEGPVQARFAIIADGAHSRTARAAGWPEIPRLIPALEHEITVSEKDFERLSRTARFDLQFPRHGYAWVFPKRAHLSVGLLSMRPGRVNLPQSFERYLSQLRLEKICSCERHGHVIPVVPRPGGFARGRLLLVGDAAGLVDPVTAEGISNALHTGELAAASLLETGFNPEKAGARYENKIRQGVLPELKAAAWLAWLLYEKPKAASWFFRNHGARLAEKVTDITLGQATYREALTKPFYYWKLLAKMFAGKSQPPKW